MALQRNKSGLSSRNHDRFEYDVFLSFRGEDTRNNFTGLFHYILELKSICTFFDEEDLHKGERIEKIFEAITKSQILVPIFSQCYAESKWCLREVAKMVECIGSEQERLIIPIFFDVDPTDVRHQTGPFEAAFKKHQKKNRDEVDGWTKALEYVGGISGYHLKDQYKGNQRQLVDSIIEEIQKVLTTKRLLHEEEYLVGVDVRVEEITNLLDFKAEGARIIGIHGIGGIGKTTLAKAIYNRNRYKFQASCFIENIREVSKSSKGGVGQLQHQLSQDISKGKRKNEIHSLSQGAKMIENMVRGKSILLVLDDVDDQKQLDALTGNISQFHSRSRVIVTTRQKKILVGLQDEAVYSLEELEETEARQLFNHHAFGADGPQEGYVNLIEEIVSISKRVPLALEVFGALFKTARTPEEWTKLLKELRRRQHSDLHEKLRICYDSLNDEEKRIFLDIACLLVGKNSEETIYVWEDLKMSPHLTLLSLQNKSLIKINKGKFEMHDLIRDMGREVVSRESPHCSRLWDTRDIMEASTTSQGNLTKGIILNAHEGSETKLSTQAFELMSELRILHINFAIFDGCETCDFKHFPASLKWLEWKGCPLKTLPLECKFKSIVVLNLSGSSISQLWSETTTGTSSKSVKEIFVRLKVLDLSSCHCLIATPNFALAPNLEKLILDRCRSLKEVDDSIGYLKKLVFLSIRECVSLEKLPNKIYELSSLQVFNLEGCEGLLAFPQIQEDWKSVTELDPDGTPFTFLPTSTPRILYINQLDRPNPKGLILRDCGRLEFLPDHPHMFPSLRSLHIAGCLKDMPFREWDIEAAYISGSSTLPQKEEYSFVLPVGSISDPLLLQQLRCHGHLDPCLNGTMVLSVHRKDLTNERWIAIGTYESRSEDSNFKNDVYGHCYMINFDSNDKINEVPRGKTTIMKVTTSNNYKLTKVDVKLQKRSTFSGGKMKPFIGISRRKASTGPPRSLPPSSLRRWISELEFSIFFNHSEEEVTLDVFENSTGIDNFIDQLMKQLNMHMQCDGSLVLFGWTNIIIFTLIFGDINALCYELGLGARFSRAASLEVFDKIKFLDLSDCKFLVKTHDFARSPNLEKLILDHCEELLEIEESIGQLKNLIQLSIVGCKKLQALPYGILQLNSLLVLDIQKCPKIHMLPEARMMDVHLNALKVLILDGCTSLTGIPDYIGGFKSLCHLSLRRCRVLTQLPNSIGRLKALEKLILDNCSSLIKLSPHVAQCGILRLLSMKYCSSLLKLPDSIRDLEVLEELILDGCTSLTDFPYCVGAFGRLRHLSLRSCRLLKQLPFSIGKLEALEKLMLDGCTSLIGIWSHVEPHRNLRVLSMKDCSLLKNLPDSIESLDVLEELILDGCTSLTEFPGYVTQLRSLHRLSLEYHLVYGQLANSIGRLKSLRSLSLKGCRSVEQLSDTIGSLVMIKELLFDCFPSLKRLPDSIGNLKCLTKMQCIRCPSLKSMPDLSGLTALEELNVAGCSCLGIIPGLEKLISLKALQMCGCLCLDLERIRSQLQMAEFHDLEAFSISAFTRNHYVGIPFPIGRRTGGKPLLVEKIDVLGSINVDGQPSHVRCEIKVAAAEDDAKFGDGQVLPSESVKDGLPYYVDAYLTSGNLSCSVLGLLPRNNEHVRLTLPYSVYSTSIGEDDEINKRIGVLASTSSDHARKVGTLSVSCSQENFCAETFVVHMVSPNSQQEAGAHLNIGSEDDVASHLDSNSMQTPEDSTSFPASSLPPPQWVPRMGYDGSPTTDYDKRLDKSLLMFLSKLDLPMLLWGNWRED